MPYIGFSNTDQQQFAVFSSPDINGTKLKLDADGDTSITADTDDQIDIEVAGSDEIKITAAMIAPATADGSALGGTSNEWSDLYLADGAVIGCYLDLDNSKLYFANDGTIQNSGTGYSIQAIADTHNGHYFPSLGDNDTASGTYEINFGNPVAALSSGNTDANGYGNFEFDPSSGTFDGASKDFLAICTKNLAEEG